MKRVLFVAYLFPPIASSGAQRSLKFVKYLAGHGWEPIVLTAARFDGHAVDAALVDELPRGVRIERVPMLHEQIGGVIATALGGGSIGRQAGQALARRWQARHPDPDRYAPWQPGALRAAKRLFRDIGFDAVFATGYPWSALTVGRAIGAATNRPFIADFRDIWTGDSDARPLHAAEADVVNGAAAVICTTDRMRQHMSNTHPAVDEARFVTIHNGFDAAEFEHAAPPRAERPFRIVYTGMWTEGVNPGALYNTIDWIRRSNPDALDNLEVVAAGFAPGEARRRGLSRHVREIGPVAHRDAIDLMRSAHLIYLGHRDPERQWAVPGKLYECLATGTPVIAQTQTDGELARMMRRLGGGKVLSAQGPGELYYTLLDACRTKTVQVPPLNADALASFEHRALTAKLAAVLDEAAQGDALHIPASRVPVPAVVVPRLRTR
ncbi:MAG: glycosyltransferase [Cyanobacteria bacterium]|nr:glycosyltransferase [Cyanobacteriota bacterium]